VFREAAPALVSVVIPDALASPTELAGPPLSPDLEEIRGFFASIGLIEPTLEEEEPVSNRGNEEEWPR
jgi:hypothetical protein